MTNNSFLDYLKNNILFQDDLKIALSLNNTAKSKQTMLRQLIRKQLKIYVTYSQNVSNSIATKQAKQFDDKQIDSVLCKLCNMRPNG